jgi:excisionase family DNA binding protein
MSQEYPLMTIEQVAQFLQLQPETVRTMARQGRIPALRVGRLWRFDRKQIELWLTDQYSRTEEADS